MLTRTKPLKRNTPQQQKPTSVLQKGPKKRPSSNPDQDGNRKRRKAAHLTEKQLNTDLVEDLLPPVATDTDRQSRFIEKSRGVMEMRWVTSKRDGGSHFNGRDDDDDEDGGRDKDEEDENEDEEDEDEDEDEEEEEEEDKDEEDEDEEDEDEEDEDEEVEEQEDEDEDEPSLDDSEIPGISRWDLLGEDFEREAAASGLYSSFELPTQLTTF